MSYNSSTVTFGSSSIFIQAFTISFKLCGGISVAMPTAIPVAPFNNKLGSLAGRTEGSNRVPSKLLVQSTVP